MKILYVTTVSVTMGFFPAHIHMLQEAGHTVELACNAEEPVPERVAELGCAVRHIPFSRSPLDRGNWTAYRELKRLLAERRYDIVHTHTPNASALVRLACRKMRGTGTRVFYTAHGFHFYKGAPLKNWMLYYPVERFLSRWTDVLITMNREDEARARTFHARRTEFVHGVGVDLPRFSDMGPETRVRMRTQLEIAPDETLLLAVGELIPRKDHETLLRVLARLDDPKIKLIIAGTGPLLDDLKALALTLNIERRVRFLGYRKDIPDLCRAADLFVFPSRQEGLPVSLMEAMAAGLPVICSEIRGNRDLIEDGRGGLLFHPTDAAGFAAGIGKLLADPEMCRQMGAHNRQAVQAFSTEAVLDELRKIYRM